MTGKITAGMLPMTPLAFEEMVTAAKDMRPACAPSSTLTALARALSAPVSSLWGGRDAQSHGHWKNRGNGFLYLANFSNSLSLLFSPVMVGWDET